MAVSTLPNVILTDRRGGIRAAFPRTGGDAVPLRHLHITGPAGAGVSSLGAALAERMGLRWFDTDDFYWLPTDPPFRVKRDVPDRLRAVGEALDGAEGWVLSGSLMGWGDPLILRFDLVVYLYVPREIRLDRLRKRERQRFGSALDPGGSMHRQHQDFLAWAAGYETGAHGGRSLEGHRRWLDALSVPVLRFEEAAPVEELVERTLAFAERL